jgi:hypothetical protein
MEQIINKIAEIAGISPETAQQAVSAILSFLQKNGPEGAVGSLINAIPGAQDFMGSTTEAAAEGGGGLLSSLAGMLGGLGGGAGGIAALGAQLMSSGLSMDQATTVGKELFSQATSYAGEDVVGEVVSSIPGLSKFV